MKVKLFLVAFGMLCLSGCYKTVNEKQFSLKLSEGEKNALMADCKEINSSGNIMTLLSEIKSLTDEAVLILEGEDLIKKEERIRNLAEAIDKKTKQVLTLSKSEWSSMRWGYEVKWVLDRQDFDDLLGAHFKKGFAITKAKVQGVSFLGEKRDDLIGEVLMSKKADKIVVSYKNTGSSLELCQLNRTMMIFMKLNYRNITNNNERYFNLKIN